MLPDKNHQPNNHYCSYLNQPLVGPPVPKNAAADRLHTERLQNEGNALMQAVRNVDFRATCSLLNSGVDPNQFPRDAKSGLASKFAPLHVATASESPFAPAVVDQLLRAGANANILARGCDGITPVHVACLTGNHNVLQLLLDSGGDPYQLDRTGRSPYACARKENHAKCLQLLHAYDGRTDATPATPQKSSPFRPRMRQNSLTSISSTALSDYHSCVPDSEDKKDEMGGIFTKQPEKSFSEKIDDRQLPSPEIFSGNGKISWQRRSDPHLDRMRSSADRIASPQRKIPDTNRSPFLKPDAKSVSSAFFAERYRVVPSAPIDSDLYESDKSPKKVSSAIRRSAEKKIVPTDFDRGDFRKRRVVGFRESTRGEFSLYDDPEFLDLCERVDRALRIRNQYEAKRTKDRGNAASMAAAVDSAIETDASMSHDDENEPSCMRYRTHHHHRHHRRHRSESKHHDDDFHLRRSRSAGNATSTTTSAPSRRSVPLPTTTKMSHDNRKRDKKQHTTRAKSSFDDAADIDTRIAAEAKLRDTAALYGYLACLNEKQLRQVLIRHGVHSNPVVSSTTRFTYIRTLVNSLINGAPAGKNGSTVVANKMQTQHDDEDDEVFPASSFETPPKKSHSNRKIRDQKVSQFLTTGDTKNETQEPAMLLINPNAESYADSYSRNDSKTLHRFVEPPAPLPPRESPVKIHLPVSDAAAAAAGHGHRRLSANAGVDHNDDRDDVLSFCRELKAVLFDILTPTQQQNLVDKLQDAGRANIRGGADKKPTKGYFCYLLLDPRVLQRPLHTKALSILTDDQKQFATFLRAIFYVGKGKRSRPMSHLVEARRRVRSAPDNTTNENDAEILDQNQSEKMQRICDIWRSGFGVVQIQCFHNCTEADAFNREAVMIEALIAGAEHGESVLDGGGGRAKQHQSKTIPGNNNKNLTNAQRGSCYGAVKHSWPSVDKRLAGAVLLHKAYQIFCVEGESQLRASEIEN